MKSSRFSKLRVENLEERTLLAVMAGGAETAVLVAMPTEAATWVVNTLEDPASWDTTDDVLSLREAIERAADGDTVTFDETLAGGTITLNGNQLEINKGIVVDASGLGGITIDADSKSRAINLIVEDGESQVFLTGLKVTGGNAIQGAAILNESGILTLTDCVIAENRSTNQSGGVDNSGTLTMFGCLVIDNVGTGLWNTGSLTMVGCTVSKNRGSDGAGIYSSGTLSMTDCTVSKNVSLGYGGGGIFSSGSLTLTRCLVSENSSMSYGGGIDISSGALTMVGCVVSGHRTGGIHNSLGDLSLTDCLVCGNTSLLYGGGIHNDFGSISLTNCTVSGNSSETGGGIYNYSRSKIEIYNSIVALNTASKSDPDISNNFSFGTVIGRNSLTSFTGWKTSVDCLEYNPNLPLFAGAEDGDYRLADNSQAINAGDNVYVKTEVDLAGSKRIAALLVDIGAYEFPLSPSGDAEVNPTVVTTELDIVDRTDGLISLRESILYAAPGDTVTFDAGLKGRTITLDGSELRIKKSLSIDASSIGGITVNANNKSRAFYIDGESDNLAVNLRALTITGGNSNGAGGAIYNTSATLSLLGCKIVGNKASATGGGICSYSADLSLINCVVSSNSACNNGGGIYMLNGSPILTGCTVAGNYARNRGGGVYCYTKPMTMINSIVALNHSQYNNDLILTSGMLSGGHNVIGFDPGFKIAPVFDSDTLTNSETIDLSLSSSSWAIDRGDNSAVASETDIVGNTRITAAWQTGKTVDIGAYEYQNSFEKTPETPSTVVQTTADVVNDTDGLISLREAIFYASTDETITFDPSLAGKTFVLQGAPLLIDKSLSIDAGNVGGVSIDACEKSEVIRIYGENRDVSINLVGLQIVGGNSESGGGIFCYSATLTLVGCSVSDNSAQMYGGGFYVCGSGDLTLIDSVVADNSSFYNGGAFYALNTGGLTLHRSVVFGNTALCGGGIYSSIPLTMTDTLVYGNHAHQDGGGIYSNDGVLTVVGCTVADNSSNLSGGGIYIRSASSSLYNTIVAQNSASGSGADIFRYFGNENPMRADSTLSSFVDWTESSNCPEYDPSAPLFAGSKNGVYSLTTGSQAIDKGNNRYVDSITDLACNARIVNDIVDLGAYEYQGQLAMPTISTGNKGVYASHGANSHKLEWDAVENAASYELAYSTDGEIWNKYLATEANAVVTGLNYGDTVFYRVRALGKSARYDDSPWSEIKTFAVCPMDINGDGDITGVDRTIMISSWLTEEGDDDYRYCADINGDGDVSGSDLVFLSNNWLCEVGVDDLVYPRPLAAADTVFAEFASAELDVDPDVF